MQVTPEMVRDLRARTGAGIMDCKKALADAEGDMEKAIEALREKGLAAAAKKAGRIASEGLVVSAVDADGRAGALAEVNCETDFVAKTDEFLNLTKVVVEKVLADAPGSLEEFMASPVEAGKSMSDLVTEKIAKIGENLGVRRFARFEGDGLVMAYIHGGGKIGVLVQLDLADASKRQEGAITDLAKDLAMQIAAASPLVVRREELSTEDLEKEKSIYRAQALNEGKPEKVVDRIVEGRVVKYFAEVCLLEQSFIKDPDKTVTQVLADISKQVGTQVTVARFARFERGEGIEKKKENFADEVMSQVNKE